MNKIKTKLRSIRVRFALIIVCVLVLVIGAMIFVNSNYLEQYTIQTKIKTIGNVMELIHAYKDDDFSDEALVELEKAVRSSNLDVVVLNNVDTLPQVIYASDFNSGKTSTRMLSRFMNRTPAAEELYEEGDGYVIYKAYDKRLNCYQIDCVGMFDDTVGFALTTPLESIRETVSLSTRFLAFLGLFAAILGGVLMYVVTSSLTKPIQELSSLSREMANLNFEARYNGTSHDEIDILGENMNHMSDALKSTIENLKEANIQLAKDLEEKERIDEMRRQFLANVSHELKTPIALIQGYAEGLKDGISVDPESMDYYCEVIIDESQKMNTIVKRLLNLDEIENGSMEVVREFFDLTELIRGVAKSSAGLLAENAECTVELNLAPGITAYADQFMIEQVVQNYMSNAYHYVSNPGRIEIDGKEDEHEIMITVFNTGNTIPEEDIERIWEKFFKVDKARTRSYGGSGIGLSIVKAIMLQHGGRYGARNRENGVEFWFTLPKVEAENK